MAASSSPATRPPRIALRAALLTLLFTNAIVVVLHALPGLERFDGLISVGGGSVGTLGAAMAAVVSVHQRLRNYLWLAAPRGREWIAAAFLGVGALLHGLVLVSRLLPDFAPSHWEGYAESIRSMDALITPFGTWILVALVGPLCEEMLFRGVILRSLLERWGAWRAVLISALAFALFHLHPAHSVNSFTFGIVVGAAVVATRSVWVAVGIHVLHNSVAVVGERLAPEAEVAPLWLLAPAIVCLGIGAWILVGSSRAPQRAR